MWCSPMVLSGMPMLTCSSSSHLFAWWRHQMETFSALLALCEGNSPVSGEFPSQRQVTRSFDVFFVLRLNKRLSKQSWGFWLETPSCPLWRHCNVACLCWPVVLRAICLYCWYRSLSTSNSKSQTAEGHRVHSLCFVSARPTNLGNRRNGLGDRWPRPTREWRFSLLYLMLGFMRKKINQAKSLLRPRSVCVIMSAKRLP